MLADKRSDLIKSNGIDYVLVKAIQKENQNRDKLITKYMNKEEFINNLNKYHIKDNQQKIIDECLDKHKQSVSSESNNPTDNINIEFCDTRQLNKTRFMIPIGGDKYKTVLLQKKLPIVLF